MTRQVLLVIGAIVLGASAHFVGENARAAQTHGEYDEDLMYLPEGRVLRMVSLGHRSFVADMVWLAAIQYYGDQRLTEQRYDQAERLFRAIYDLDPEFKGATRFGALVLAQDAKNPAGAIALLDRAVRDHPDTWEYPFDRGFIYQTVLSDFGAAGESYRMASRLPGAPDLAVRLAGLSFARLGDRDAARDVWTAMRDAGDNDAMVRIAQRSLKNLDLEDAEDLLSDAMLRFRRDNDRDAEDWAALVAAGYLEAVPPEPFGGLFFLDAASGRVYSTTHVDRRMAQERGVYAQLVRSLHEAEGAWPASLADVVDRGLALSGPWEPFGLTLDYEPEDGTVSWNPPWPETEPGKHGEGRG